MTVQTHATVRARERYGIDLSLADLREMSRRCAKGEGLQRRGHGGQVHMLVFGDRVLQVVYVPTDDIIATVLPPEASERVTKRDNYHKAKRISGFSRRNRR